MEYKLNPNQEGALIFFAKKENLSLQDFFGRIVSGAIQPYELALTDAKEKTFIVKWQAASPEVKVEVEALIGGT